MRIGIVIPSFFPAIRYGGWVNSSWAMCRELAKNDVECYVSTTNVNGEAPLVANNINFKPVSDNIFVKYYTKTIKERFSLAMAVLLWRDLMKSEIVYAHGIFDFCTPLALFYGRWLKKPIIISPHGCLGDWCMASGIGTNIKKLYLNLFIKPFANKITWLAASQQETKEILAHYPRASIRLIPAGLSLNEFASSQNSKDRSFYLRYLTDGEGVPEKVIVSVGRLDSKKGFDVLISSFAITLQEIPGARLFIVGEDFGEKCNLLKQVNQLGLDSKIFFLGHISETEKNDFLRNADVFALATHNENFGIVYAEALACGTPIVATKNTPWEEAQTAGVGKWVDNSPAAISAAISELLSSDDQHISQRSREFIGGFSSEAVTEKFRILFNELSDSVAREKQAGSVRH